MTYSLNWLYCSIKALLRVSLFFVDSKTDSKSGVPPKSPDHLDVNTFSISTRGTVDAARLSAHLHFDHLTHSFHTHSSDKHFHNRLIYIESEAALLQAEWNQ